MNKQKWVLAVVLSMAALSTVGCNKKKGGGSGSDSTELSAAVQNLPTEEDFEEAAEAKITPETLDSEIAKLEDELKDTKPAAK